MKRYLLSMILALLLAIGLLPVPTALKVTTGIFAKNEGTLTITGSNGQFGISLTYGTEKSSS